jgi:hypothetical protein
MLLDVPPNRFLIFDSRQTWKFNRFNPQEVFQIVKVDAANMTSLFDMFGDSSVIRFARDEQHLTTFRNIKDIHPLSNTGDRNRQISQLQRLAALRTSPNKQRLINRKNILNEPV